MSALQPIPDYRPPPPAPTGWPEQAACRFEDPDLFYPPEEERGRYAALREMLAKRICLGCPVLRECTDYALANDERYGVWGGLTPADRNRLRRRSA
jgi:WhiB family transcriptional regulator, redox-sensing transcriptional regulator